MAKRRGFPPVYKIERVAKMSVKRAFFSVFQKIMVICGIMMVPLYRAPSRICVSKDGWVMLRGVAHSAGVVFKRFTILCSVLLMIFATPAHADDACKNLLNPANIINGSLVQSNVNSTNIRVATNDLIPVTPGQQYTVSVYDANGAVNPDFTIYEIYGYNDAGGFNNNIRSTNATSAQNVTFTVPGTSVNIRFSIKRVDGATIAPADVQVQLEKGSTATSYVPYNPLCATCDGVIKQSPNLFDETNVFPKSGTVNASGIGYHINNSNMSTVRLEEGVTYTLSFDVESSVTPFRIGVGAGNGNYTKDVATSALNRTSGRNSITFTPNAAQLSSGNIFAFRAIWTDDIQNITYSISNVQLEVGNTATDYHPYGAYCAPEIKIATTAYNAARFSPVVTDLNSAVATIREIVTKTINQTAAIASLQADKQTRPADDYTDETNTENCPKFRQCLLVEDNNNIPHWYLIKDPVRDLVKSLRDNKINSAGETTTTAYAANGFDGTNGTTDSRYYKGYPAMRKLADGSTFVQNRQFGASLTGGDNGGQYKTLGDQEWAVTWDGAETGTAGSFLSGVIYGTSRCSKVKPSSTAVGTEGWNTIENSDPVNDAENIQSYVQCYCKMTGVGVDGEFTPVRDSSRAPWVFHATYGSAADCADNCASYCAYYVRDNASFRQRIMDWAVE